MFLKPYKKYLNNNSLDISLNYCLQVYDMRIVLYLRKVLGESVFIAFLVTVPTPRWTGILIHNNNMYYCYTTRYQVPLYMYLYRCISGHVGNVDFNLVAPTTTAYTIVVSHCVRHTDKMNFIIRKYEKSLHW